MSDVSQAEAIALLSQHLCCQDCGDWVVGSRRPGTFTINAGLIDRLGRATPLTVELLCQGKTRRAKRGYLFTVLRRNRYNIERVYQLGIIQTSKEIKDKHSWPHEHVGNMRSQCPEQALDWDYDETFDYFCGRTNISFLPAPSDPLRLFSRI
jgi:hypothetical protein